MKIFLALPILLLLTMLSNQIIQARPQKRSSFNDHDGLQGSREIDDVIPFVDAPQENQIVKHFQNGELPYHPRGYAHVCMYVYYIFEFKHGTFHRAI